MIFTQKQAREDANRLYDVSKSIYNTLIVLNWFIGIVGVILSFIFFSHGPIGVGVAFLTLFSTLIACSINYAVAVLATHGAMVLAQMLRAQLSGGIDDIVPVVTPIEALGPGVALPKEGYDNCPHCRSLVPLTAVKCPYCEQRIREI
jgi:hypothetical protein